MNRATIALFASSLLAVGACTAGTDPVANAAEPTPEPAVEQDRNFGVKVGDTAPTFTAKGSDGKEHSLAALSKDKPVILYFIKQFCSANPAATPFTQQLYAAYGDKANFIGVINADDEGFKSWNNEYKVKYTTLYDPDKKIIRAYGIAKSHCAVLVGKDGKVTELFRGWGQGSLKNIEKAMAANSGVAVKPVNVSAAPAGEAYG
jgi:peroxiredoxin